MRRAASAFALCASLCTFAACNAQSTDDAAARVEDPVPRSVAEFQAAAARVLDETGVPGAGLALVRQAGVEWAGGVGYADRDRQIPVTADTAFRVGSISKTFVAMALVQLSEDGLVDLDAPIAELAPDVRIVNPWEESHPVRLIHLLQHTAGFDDMHFNEMYVPDGRPERTLEEVLQINPRSRRVRWPPGTRMAYANPGYAVAGLVLERSAGMPYEDYIDQEIFQPLQMFHSSFRLSAEDEARLARGYASPDGSPVAVRQIYLRPAGNMISTPHDLGRFVQMLLGWGELGDAFVVDPEYLGNMEQPRTTRAADAGLRNGYGTGIFATVSLPYKMLGHSGGIDGFLSSYAYSPSRDVGYVVLLNSTGGAAAAAMERLSRLAIAYLKSDVAPPDPPASALPEDVLDRYVGYYHDANPRNQFAWPLQSLFSGRTITREGHALFADPVAGPRQRLVPVTETMFRLDRDVDASLVFTTDDEGVMILAGPQLYAQRTSRWRIDMLRVSLLAAASLTASVFVVAIVWVARIRRAAPRGFWELKIALLLCPLVLLLPLAGLATTPLTLWGTATTGTIAAYLGTLAIPAAALLVAILNLVAIRERASRALVTYAGLVALAMAGIALYLSVHDMIGLRTWTY